MSGSTEEAVVIVAIDFGTTFSGYAYSFTGAPEVVLMNKNWGSESGSIYFKAPTSVLTQVSEDGKSQKFLEFGFAAEHAYTDRPSDESKEDKDRICLFNKFKMKLYSSDSKVTIISNISDVNQIRG